MFFKKLDKTAKNLQEMRIVMRKGKGQFLNGAGFYKSWR